MKKEERNKEKSMKKNKEKEISAVRKANIEKSKN